MPNPLLSIGRAVIRPETYPGHLRELASLAVTAAVWPFGVVDHGLDRKHGYRRTGDAARLTPNHFPLSGPGRSSDPLTPHWCQGRRPSRLG